MAAESAVQTVEAGRLPRNDGSGQAVAATARDRALALRDSGQVGAPMPVSRAGRNTGADEPGSVHDRAGLRSALKCGADDATSACEVLPAREGVVTPGGDRSSDAPSIRIGRFELLEEVGRGAHGVVYRARDPALGREIALKLPRFDTLLSHTLRLRFRQEALAIASVRHRNIIQVFECGDAGPEQYIATEYCDGLTLAAWQRGLSEPVPERLAAMLLAELADAVAHVHSRGILHRDLKPGNVLLDAASDPRCRSGKLTASAALHQVEADELPFIPKLTDFGLAKLLEAVGTETRTGAALGTPQYMAPEQAQGCTHEIGTACDIYALGAILYELLTGRTPFVGSTPLEILRRAAENSPEPLRRFRPGLSRDLQAICLKCLEFRPADRYATAAALRDDLRTYLKGGVVSVRNPGALGRAVKWARRSPTRAGLVAVAAVALLVAFGGVTWQWRRAEEFRLEAENNLRRAHAGIRDLHEVLLAGDQYDRPEFQDLRRQLMEVSLRNYLGLLDNSVDRTALQNDVAATCYQIGLHSHGNRDWDDAAHYFAEAVRLWRPLLEQQPDDRSYRDDLSKALLHLAESLCAKKRYDEAEPLLLDSIRIRTAVVAEEGDRDATLIGTLGDAHFTLAFVYRATGRPAEAISQFKLAINFYERSTAIGVDPHRTINRVRLSRAHQDLGKTCELLGQVDEARFHCDSALALQTEIWKQDRNARQLQETMLRTLSLSVRLNPSPDEELQNLCENLCAEFTARSRDNPRTAISDALLLRDLARANVAAGDFDRGSRRYRDACRLLEPLENSSAPDDEVGTALKTLRGRLRKTAQLAAEASHHEN